MFNEYSIFPSVAFNLRQMSDMAFFSVSVFDVLSQFVMLYMLLSLSMGWTLAGTHKPIHLLSHLKDKPAAKVVSVIGILQVSQKSAQELRL